MSTSKSKIELSLFAQLQRMYTLGKPFGGQLVLCLLLILTATIIQLLLPLGIRIIFDNILLNDNISFINWMAVSMLLIFIIRSIFSFFGQFFLQVIGDKVVVSLRNQVFNHFHTLSLGYHHANRVGDLLSRLNSDVMAIRNVIANLSVSFVINIFQLTGSIVIMMIMNWKLGIIVLFVCPLTTITAKAFGPYFQRISKQIQHDLASSTTIAQESLSGVEVANAFARGPHEAQRYAKIMRRFLNRTIQARKSNAFFNAIITFLASSTTIAIFWFGGIQIINGYLSAGTLVAFLLYSQTVTQSISALAQYYSALNQSIGASQRVFEILDIESKVRDKPNAIILSDHVKTITFNDVYFEYIENKIILSNIALKASNGETIALVGASGSGKSTLLNLIPRFYDTTRGVVSINDHDIRDYTLESLREKIAIVPQDTFLFGTTILENIRYGRLDASEQDVKIAAKSANADEFIEQLPEGYQTHVGERGVQISGGQRQRIAIARALLKKASILILDEATSAIDSASEVLIQMAIERLKAERIIFIIAHRRETIRIADQIIVIHDGKIMARPSYKELMAYEKSHPQEIFKRTENEIVSS